MNYITFNMKDLPSKGLFYPEVKELKLKKYTLDQINSLNNTDRSLKDLIEDFKKDIEGLEPEKILYMDFLYMALFRTASVYNNSKLELSMNCPYCSERIDVQIDYSKVELFDFNDYLDLFPIKIKINKETVDFNLPTIAMIEKLLEVSTQKIDHEVFVSLKKEDYKTLSQDDRNYYKALENKEIALLKEDKLALLEESLKSITYGILSSVDTYKVCQLLKGIDDVDTLEILSLVDDLSSKTFKKYQTSCPKCNKDIELSLEGMAIMLRPFRTSTQSIADKIRASQKVSSESE